MRRLPTLIAAFLAASLAALPGRAFETDARAAYAYDVTTDTELLAKNADEPLPPASMSKLMTLYMLFEALHEDRVTLHTRFPVSTKAKKMGGSTMFLNETDEPTVEALIKGIIVQSGNDASVAVAEGLAGTEAAFAEEMNAAADELGLDNSHFVNSSGWPSPRHRMSVHDLARLATAIITRFPEYYEYFALQEYDFDGRAPQNRFNRNPLLELDIGADGLKTGHTQKAGYGLVGSAKRDGRRIVFVLAGLDSEAARAKQSRRLLEWAFQHFERQTLAKTGAELGRVNVWMGGVGDVGLVAPKPIEILLPKGGKDGISAKLRYDSPVEAPVEAGDQLADLVISIPDMPVKHVPLAAGADIPRGGFVPRLRTAAGVLFDRFAGGARDLY